MLKIKDNIDLKELEKFDFRVWEEVETIDGVKILYYKYCFKNFYLYITKERKIFGEQSEAGYVLGQENLDTLFDLIQANLVEKV